jgi:peptidoglycan/xylan/chitin deacetylase (PgdA/CDA1 family)
VKALLLTFDVEEFDLTAEVARRLSPSSQLRASASGLRRILPLLARHRAPATFFVTGAFAQAHPRMLQDLAAAGHEVAVHGLAHSDDYSTMPPEEAVERLRHARQLVDAAGAEPAIGVRTPRLRPCPPALLHRAGFAYDASPHPTWVPGRYNGLRHPRHPWREDGILRLPISVLPAVRWPVSWLWYRLAGARLGLAAARCATVGAPYLHLYFHPWEALRLSRFGIAAWLGAGSGPPFVASLDHLLRSSAGRLEPMTLREFTRRL